MIYIYYTNDVFCEVANSLFEALGEKGFICYLVKTISNNNDADLYIIFGLNNPIQFLPKNYIAYQLEQTGNKHSWFSNQYVSNLQSALEIWDYSLRNIQNCKAFPNLPITRYVPIGYTKNLTKIVQPPVDEKIYDIAFYGSANPRRDAIIDNLRSLGLKVYYSTYQSWGSDRDLLISKSRIILNIHFYENPILETTRISYLLANGAFVISEPSLDPILDRDYKNLVVFSKYNDIPTTCLYYINNPHLITEFAKNSYEAFKQNKYIDKIPTSILEQFANGLNNNNIIINDPLYKSVETIDVDGGVMLKLSNSTINEHNAPKITLITPTHNRHWAMNLAIRNFYSFNYPIDKLEWIILDSSKDNLDLPDDNRIKYIKTQANDPIWLKRNTLANLATGDIIIHLDDDDYYFPESVMTKVKLLDIYKSQGIQCIGSTDLGVYHLIDNYSYLTTNTKYLAEASMAYYRSFWIAKPFNNTNLHLGEGFGFTEGRNNQIITMPYYFNLIAFTHNQNYTGKLRSSSNLQNHNNFDNFFNLWDDATKLFVLDLKKQATSQKNTPNLKN